MTSIAKPPGYDPASLPGYPFGIGPMLNWYDNGNPGGVPGSCEPCEDVEETSVPFTPDPAAPAEPQGGGGSSLTASRGNGTSLTTRGGTTGGVRRGAAMLGIARRVGVTLPAITAPEGCAGSGVCTGWLNLDGSLAMQVSAAATGEPFGKSLCLTLNSAGPATPTEVGPWVSSVETKFYPALNTLRTPIGTKLTYSGSPNPGEYYTTPLGVESRLKRTATDLYEETQPNGLKKVFSSGKLTTWSANAGTWTVQRDGGPVQAIIDPAGRRTTFSYDGPGGKLSKITDSGGRDTLFSFNGDNLEKVTSPEGCETSFTYEDLGGGRVQTWTTPSGYKTTFSYETDGRLNKVQRPDGGMTITYDTDMMQIQDARGFVTTYTKYASGELKAVINPKNERLTYTWENKWPKTIQDGRGNLYTFTYQTLTADANIAPVKSIQLPAGGIVTYQMDTSDNLQTITDERGYVTTLNWSSGRLSSVQNAKGDLTTYGYTTQYKQLRTITNPLGKTWSMTYDGTGRKTEDKDPLGNATSYTYDAAGCPKTVKNPLGKVTTYAFDAMNRIETVTNPKGETISYTYASSSCLLETIKDALGRVTTQAYDTNGRLKATVDALGKITSYS